MVGWFTRTITRVRAKFVKPRPPPSLSIVDASRQYRSTPTTLPSDPVLSQHRPPESALPALAEHRSGPLGRAPNAPRLSADGTPVSPDVIEAPLIAAVSKRPEAVAAAQNAHVNDPVATTAASLETSRTGWAANLKAVLTSNFILVALAGAAVGTYFIATAEMRRQCIKAVFARYPQFMNADRVEELMAGYNDQPCGTTESEADKLCAAVHDAYHMLKECDNTLMQNIVAAALNVGAQVTGFFGEEMEKAFNKLTGIFSGALPIILGVVGAIILVCIALFFLTRQRGHGAGNGFIGNVRGRFRRLRGAGEQAEQAFGKAYAHMRMRSAARALLS